MSRATLYALKPSGEETEMGAVILVPGVNSDDYWRLNDHGWRRFAASNRLWLVVVSFASPLEILRNGKGYYYPAQGSGDVLLSGLREIDCEDKTLILYGFSGGAHFVSRFVIWHSKNICTWCANSAAWWDELTLDRSLPPGIVACGTNDFRVEASRRYFEAGRSIGAPWLWLELPGVGHNEDGNMEDFFRDYAQVLIQKTINDGIWVNVHTGTLEEDAFVERFPCTMGWLPSQKLYTKWCSLLRLRTDRY